MGQNSEVILTLDIGAKEAKLHMDDLNEFRWASNHVVPIISTSGLQKVSCR